MEILLKSIQKTIPSEIFYLISGIGVVFLIIRVFLLNNAYKKSVEKYPNDIVEVDFKNLTIKIKQRDKSKNDEQTENPDSS